jgi:polar amino acid transport system substrate-binding protein
MEENKMKKGLLIGLICMFFVALSACGQSSNTTSGTSDASKGTETIRVVTTAGGAPFGIVNPQTSKYEGFMYDIINDLAKRANLKVDMQTAEWDALIPSLQSGKADVIVDGMYITPERQKVINFTDPVFGYGEGLIVQEGDKKTKSLEDLKGKTVGVQIGTSYKDMLDQKNKSLNLNIKTYQTTADLLKDIENKRLDAAIADSPTFTYLKSKNPGANFRIVDDYVPSLAGKIGIGVAKKNTALVEKLNKAIAAAKKDGTIKKIYKKWGVDWNFN